MNEEIVLNMCKPYVKDGSITYIEFDRIFNMLSIKEQYIVTDILFKNGINLVDKCEQIDEEVYILETEEVYDEDEEYDFEILYDKSIFKDQGLAEDETSTLTVNYSVKQSNDILCSLIQEGNRQATQDLCVKNKRLVDKYVLAYQKRYGNRLDFEDLEQVGYVGLIKAANKFDFNQGTAFSTYAVFWIKQAISREIMDNGYAIRIPVYMMERINKVVHWNNIYNAQGHELNERIGLIASELSLSDDTVRESLILKTNYLSYASLNAPVGAEDETELGELLPEQGMPSVEDIISDNNLREVLQKVIETLTAKEQKVLRLRFGIDNGRTRTLEEVGKEFGVTRERIRQIEAKALRKLRHPSRSRQLVDFLYEGGA